MLRQFVHSLFLAAGFGASLVPSAAAQPICALGSRVPFAGHTLPLEGDLSNDAFAANRAFPNLPDSALGSPILLTHAGDGTNRIFSVQQDGVIQVFPNDPSASVAQLETFLDLQSSVDTSAVEEGLLGLAFHPDYSNNGYLYVHYTSDDTLCSLYARCARVVRYQRDPQDPDRADPASASVVLEIERPGNAEEHNGGMLAFGADGYLYVAVGDGGQRALAPIPTSLRGKILRIDVDSGTEFNPGIPAGNPFANEVWHIGLRNPWRFSFDREQPGDMWISDVGQASWEEVNFVPAGDGGGLDFGWPSCEGTHPYEDPVCDPNSRLPDIEYAHSSAFRSVIGGFVYRGSIASLNGSYVYADINGEIFRWDTTSRDPNPPYLAITEEIVPTTGDRVASFGEDEAGELYAVALTGARLRRIETGGSTPGDPFPESLSQTGLFSDVASLTPAPGLIEYDVVSALWSDGAVKKRWIALPGSERIAFAADGSWDFPIGTALVKHFELNTGAGLRRLETRVMLRQESRWLGLTYHWNLAQNDADLLRDELEEAIPLSGGGSQTWTYPSPGECLSCHNSPSGRILGVRTRQFNRVLAYSGGSQNQLEAWNCIDLFDTDIGDATRLPSSAALSDQSASRQHRVRSYFASNCSHCHQPGTGVANIDLRPQVLLGGMNAIGMPPTRGDLGLPSPQIIAAGAHASSVLWLRTDSSDETLRMPAGTRLPHAAAVAEIAAWIDSDLFDAQTQMPSIDSDEDGALDGVDNCPAVSNAAQQDQDSDGVGDACDPDQQADLRAAPIGPRVVGLGQAVFIDAAVFNDGASPAPSSQVRFYLSADAILDAGDALVGDCLAGPALAAGSAACTDTAANVPSDAAWIGAMYWLSCADSLELIAESDESNNCQAAPVQVSATVSQLPSLSPSALIALALSLLAVVLVGPRRGATRRHSR